MLLLLCLCCDHRNPAGSSYCNACGMPLHLRPCPKCETINGRAASHCRKCGEAFTFDFALAAADEGNATEMPPALPGPPQTDTPPGPRAASSSRASALLVGVVAAAGLSAFYAYRDPAQVGDGTRSAEAASAPVAATPQAATVIVRSEDQARATPTPSPVPAPSPVVAPAASPATASLPAKRSARTKDALARPRAMVASQTRAKPTTVRKVVPKRSRRDVQLATATPVAGRQGPVPSASRDSCAEGSALASGCDPRMIAKGN